MQAPLQTLTPLGNDVVDLRTAHNLRSATNPRYRERVLSPIEQRALAGASVQNLAFWAYWSAKEAAYKALKKATADLILSHRRFVVTPCMPWTTNSRQNGTAIGTVEHGNHQLEVKWNWDVDWVHCLTSEGSASPTYKMAEIDDLAASESFSKLKSTTELSDQSIVARLLALSLLEDEGYHDVEILRPADGHRPGPPAVYRNGKHLPHLDISLSHDGRYAAAAVVVEPVN